MRSTVSQGINGYIKWACEHAVRDYEYRIRQKKRKSAKKIAITCLYNSDVKYEYGLKIGDSKELLGKYCLAPSIVKTKNMDYEDLYYKKHIEEQGYRLRRLVFLDGGKQFRADFDRILLEIKKSYIEKGKRF